MPTRGPRRWRWWALPLLGATALLLALWAGRPAGTAPQPTAAADSTGTRGGPTGAGRPPRVPPPRFPASTAGRVRDLAELGRSPGQASDDPAWTARIEPGPGLTAEDLANPDRYFSAAAGRPELLRPEELSDARAFFLRYRAQLGADMAELADDPSPTAGQTRSELTTVAARYDAAIARAEALLRKPTQP